MPFFYKKAANVARISRIVADLQQPKPNSLVVETGFPTSLVDLFVKNRDRLKKSTKKKKKQQRQHSQPREVEQLLVLDTIPSPKPTGLPVEPVDINKNCGSPVNLEVQFKNVDRCEGLVGRDRNLDYNQGIKDCGVVDHGNLGSNRKEKRFLSCVLKVFLIVVLAMSTTRLAVGITMSASLLIFLEYSRKRLLCLMKTCLLALLCLISRVVSLFRVKKDLWVSKKGSINAEKDGSSSDSCNLVQSLESNIPIKDIHVLEPRIDMVGPTKIIENQTVYDLSNKDKRWDSGGEAAKAEDDAGGVMICEKDESKSSKIRRKIIKKLVPKKLRSENKGKKEKEADFRRDESSCCWPEDKLCKGENTEEQSNLDQQDSTCKGKQLWQLMKEEKEEEIERFGTEGNEEFEHRCSISIQPVNSKPEIIAVEQRMDIQRGSNSRYLILLLIVLAGLVGGRMLALVTTVTSCSMLKLFWRRRRCEK